MIWNNDDSQQFYVSSEWKTFRKNWIKNFGGDECEKCGTALAKGSFNYTLDHIVPLTVAPHLRLEDTNIVVMCRSCNSRKNNKLGITRTNYVNTKLVQL